MSKAQHTPGPWFRYGNEILNEKDGFAIAKVICFNDYDESYANTKLIAAAPELLDISKSILADDILPLLPDEYIAKVSAAIAKAEGK